MNDDNTQAITLIACAVAGIISVASASERYDLVDSAIGIIIWLFIWPILKAPKSAYWKYLVSVVTGLCILLIFGAAVDFYPTKLNWGHFIIWLVGTISIYYMIPYIENKHNKANSADAKKQRG